MSRKDDAAKDPLVIVIDPCQRICEWDGTVTVLRHEPTRQQMQEWDRERAGPLPLGQPLPDEDQLSIGGLLVSLLRFWEPEKATDKFLIGRIGLRIAQAMKAKTAYRAGDIAGGLLRKMVEDYRDKKVGFQRPAPNQPLPPGDALLYAQLAEAVGLDTGYQDGAAGEVAAPAAEEQPEGVGNVT